MISAGERNGRIIIGLKYMAWHSVYLL